MQELVEDLQFHALRKVRIESPAAPPSNVASAPRWIASSSAYGITVVVTAENRIYSCKSADLHSLDFYSVQQADVTGFPHRTIDYFDGTCQIAAVDVNAEERVIAFAVNSQNGPFVHLFDVCAFLPDYTQQPFPLASVRLTSDSAARLCAFEWNPALPEMFAASSTDKTLTTINYSPEQGSSFSVVGTAQMKDVVTCISWSPKGKQLVVGDAAGRMHQLKPELTSVRVVEPPGEIPQLPGPHRCVGLCWISTTEWLIAHASASNKANVSLLTIKKGQPSQWQPYGDVAFASALSANPLPIVYRFVPIFDWQLVLISSSHSTEVAVIGHRRGNWVHFAMETYSIQLPVDKEKKDTYPLGTTLDLSSTRNVKLPTDDSSTGLPPQPFVYTLTSDGHLLPYIAVSLDGQRPALTKSPKGIAPGEVRNGSAPPGYTPRPQVVPPQPAAAVPIVPVMTSLQAAPAVPTISTPFTAISQASTAPVNPSVLQTSATVPAVTVEDPKVEAERRRQAAEAAARKQLEELESGLKMRVNEYCNARNEFAQKVDLVRELRAQVDHLDAESNFDQLQEMEDVLQSVRVSLDDAFLTAEQLRESILNNTVHVKEIRIIYDETQRKKALKDDSETALTFNQAKKMELLEGKYLRTLEKFGKLESLSKELITAPQGKSPRRRPLRSKDVIPPEEQAKINQITKNIATTVTRLASRITLLQKEIKNLRVMDENTGVAKPNRKALDEAITKSRHYTGAVDAVTSQCTAMINRLMIVVDEPKKKRDSYLFKQVDSSEVRSQLRRFMTQHCSKPIPIRMVEPVRLLPDTTAAPRTPKKDDSMKSVNDVAISARLQQVMTPPQKPRLISVATQSPSAWRQDELSSIFEPPSTMLDSMVAPNDSVFASTARVAPTAKPTVPTMTFNPALTPSSVLTPANTQPMASTPIEPQAGVAARTLFPFATTASPVRPVPSIAPVATVVPVPPLSVASTSAEVTKPAVAAAAPSTVPTSVVTQPAVSTTTPAAPAMQAPVPPVLSVPATSVTSIDVATTVTTIATTAPTPQASTTTTTAPLTETTAAEVPKPAFGTLFKPATTTTPPSTVAQATSPFGAFSPGAAATSPPNTTAANGSAGTRPSFSFKPPTGGFAAPAAAAAPTTTTAAAAPSSFSFKAPSQASQPNGTSPFGATTGNAFPSAAQQQPNQDEGMEDDTTAATAASFSFMGGGLGSSVPQAGAQKSPFGGLNLANRQPTSSSSWFASTAKPAQQQPAAAATSSTTSTFGGSAFGGRPAFGSGPSFGSQSAFGGGSSTGSAFGGSPFASANKSPFASGSSSGSAFGGSGATSGGFSAFAAKSSAFGQLAQQASPQQSAFGGGAKPAFGSFGGGTGSAFGGGSSPSTFGGGANKSSAFTTFRK